ncbi:hypothetical protein HNR23_000240 [Nocardiopsis mwathae]|uniref:DUF2613 domain-containing protein n=1 Tax=Nocardiopsis mwathae TaxID=1472723 RepID=A0A7X0D3L3_9ACTN|nr:hypothetical protein [Nocardiopsis mwathae]MBB6170180.1 hypothetical protein [Nocardiopsis mwathae]
MIKIVVASVIGAAMAGTLALVGSTVATNANSSAQPVNESLYNYGDR